MTSRTMPVAVVGMGRVGSLMAQWVQEAGYVLSGVTGRPGKPSKRVEAVAERLEVPILSSFEEVALRANVVIIASPDDAVPEIAGQLAPPVRSRGGRSMYVLHTSGALGSDVLLPVRLAGAAIGSMHPLQTFSDPHVVRLLLHRTYFGLEGDPDAVEWAQGFVRRIGAKCLALSPEGKTLYHAAASVASNYLIALLHLSDRLMADSGALSPGGGGLDAESTRSSVPDGFQLLLPLVEATRMSAQENGLAAALTGPVARGDVNTIRRHLESLRDRAPYAIPVYSALGSYTAHVATEAGMLDPGRAEELLLLLKKEAHG